MRARFGSQTPCFEGRALVPQGCSRPLRLAGRAGRGRELRRESPVPIPILVPIPVPVSIPVPVPVPSSSRPGRAQPSPASRALRRLRKAGTGAGGRRWRRPSESRGGGGSRAEGGGRAGLKSGRAEPGQAVRSLVASGRGWRRAPAAAGVPGAPAPRRQQGRPRWYRLPALPCCALRAAARAPLSKGSVPPGRAEPAAGRGSPCPRRVLPAGLGPLPAVATVASRWPQAVSRRWQCPGRRLPSR